MASMENRVWNRAHRALFTHQENVKIFNNAKGQLGEMTAVKYFHLLNADGSVPDCIEICPGTRSIKCLCCKGTNPDRDHWYSKCHKEAYGRWDWFSRRRISPAIRRQTPTTGASVVLPSAKSAEQNEDRETETREAVRRKTARWKIVNRRCQPTHAAATSSESEKQICLCIICEDEESVCAAIPCGHKCICATCLVDTRRQLERCPICRNEVQQFCRIFDV